MEAVSWRKSLGKGSRILTYEGEKRMIGIKVSCENKVEINVGYKRLHAVHNRE